MTRTLFLHIGFPKTGTTALQRSVFPSLREHGFFYAGNDDALQRDFARAFGRHVHDPASPLPVPAIDADNILVSCEGITYDCLKYLDAAGNFMPLDCSTLARQCERAAGTLSPDAVRVLVSFRQQGVLSHSVFAQSYTHFFSHSKDCADYHSYAGQILAGAPLARPYDFHTLTRELHDVFGRDHVLVMFHEDLVADPAAYLGRLSAFLGAPLPRAIARANVRKTATGRRTQASSLYHELAYIADRYLPGMPAGLGKHLQFLKRVGGRKAGMIAAEPDLEARITAAYAASNRALGDLLGRDLSAIGYY